MDARPARAWLLCGLALWASASLARAQETVDGPPAGASAREEANERFSGSASQAPVNFFPQQGQVPRPDPPEYPDLSRDPARYRVGEGIPLTKWVLLQPSFQQTATYDTNVFQALDDGEADIELTSTYQLGARAFTRHLQVGLLYRLVDRHFLDQSELDGQDTIVRGEMILALGDLRIEAQGGRSDLNRPADPRFTQGVLKRIEADLGLTATYALTRRFAFRLEFNHLLTDYQSALEDPLDFSESTLDGFLVLRSPHRGLDLLLGAGTHRIRYTNARAATADVDLARLWVGIERPRRPFRQLSGRLRVGLEAGELVEIREQLGEPDPAALIVDGNLNYDLGQRSSIIIDASRIIEISVGSSAQVTSGAGFGFLYNFGRSLSTFVRLGYSTFKPLVGDEVTSYNVSAALEWGPRSWIDMACSVAFDQSRLGEGTLETLRAGFSLTVRL